MLEHREILAHCFELAGLGRLAEAEDLVERALLDSPDDGRLWQSVGLFRHRMGDFAGACQSLETAGLLVPLDPKARSVLAECFARTGHPDLAGDLYRSLSSDPACPDELLPELAAGLGYLGMYGAALATCLELVRRAPSMAEAHFGMAFYLRRLGQPAEAILPVVARAHELAPEVPLYRISLATLLDHSGRRDEARELIRDLDLDQVSCRGCLRRMTTIFLTAGRDGSLDQVHPDHERSSRNTPSEA
jgi:Flp pilus assembly protein TadD